MKTLRGYKDLTRARVGCVRIIFRGIHSGDIATLKIVFRNDQMYS